MNRRRGLTLIEVLAATVLLTALAAACLPVLRSAFSVLHERGDEFQIAELSALVDRLRADPDDFGMTFEQITRPKATFEIPWPEKPERPAVRASVETQGLQSLGVGASHAWLVLTAVDREGRSWSVSRLIPLAEEDRP